MQHNDTKQTPAAKGDRKKKNGNSSWRVFGTDIRRWSRDHAFALLCAGLFFVVNILHSVWLAARRAKSGTSNRRLSLDQALLDERHGALGYPKTDQSLSIWLTHVFGSLVLVRGVFMTILYTLLILIIMSVAQTRLGAWRTAWVALVSALGGTLIGLAICFAVSFGMRDWTRVEHLPVLLSPLTLIIGAIMAESAFESVLWRRRIVLLGYTVVGTLLLFSGNPGDYCTLAAVLVGHLLGLTFKGRNHEHVNWTHGTDYEVRRLFTLVQLVLAVGPIFALTSTSRQGPLTVLGLFTSSVIGDSSLLPKCGASRLAKSCILITGQHHIALIGLWLHILLPVAAVAVVAWGLYHGRRLAAQVSMVLNSLTVLFAVIYYVIFPLTITPWGPQMRRHYAIMPAFIATALPPLLLVIFMVGQLQHFEIRTPRKQLQAGLATILGVLVVASAGYAGYALSMPDAFRPRATPKLLALDMLHRLLPSGFAGRKSITLRPHTLTATLTGEGLTAVFWIAVLIVFILWFRDNVTPDEHDRAKANKLVEAGGESMSFMTTWEDNHYWFSASGHSAIAYRVLHGIALTVTGPFGDPNEYAADLKDFAAFCETRGWSPAFYAVHDDQRELLEAAGCSSIQVGTEMVIDPNAWQTRGKKWQDIRTAINKAKRDGITDEFGTYASVGFDVQQQIVEISEQWAQLKALPEMKFTLGGVEELRDERVALLYAKDAQGKLLGVTSWLPTYHRGRVIGWTLDFMRHRTDSPNGIMEFLIARMAERLRDQGQADPAHAVEFMSLSAAPLAGMGEGRAPASTAVTAAAGETDADPQTKHAPVAPAASAASEQSAADDKRDPQSGTQIIEHALQIVADLLEPAYGFKSLFFFKRKFQPSPAPIYICYADSAKLAQIGIAVVNAYVPELKANQVMEILKTMTAKKEKPSGRH